MRAQIKMFETVGVLIVFFILLVTAGAFYFGLQRQSIDQERFSTADNVGLQTALRVIDLPELDCSLFGTVRDNCIDKYRLESFSDLLKNDDVVEDYFSGFGFSTITVRDVWPCNVCGSFVLYNNTRAASVESATVTPVLIHDPWLDTYSFGVVEVVVYV